MPLVIKLPGNRHGGTRVTGLARLIDVAPSMLDALGIAIPDSFQGRTLLSATPGTAQGPPRVVYGYSSSLNEEFVRTADYKYIRSVGGDLRARVLSWLRPRRAISLPAASVRAEQLYDLHQDPHETTPVAADEQPTELAELRDLAEQHARDCLTARLAVTPGTVSAPPAAPDAERLRALGYVATETKKSQTGSPPQATATVQRRGDELHVLIAGEGPAGWQVVVWFSGAVRAQPAATPYGPFVLASKGDADRRSYRKLELLQLPLPMLTGKIPTTGHWRLETTQRAQSGVGLPETVFAQALIVRDTLPYDGQLTELVVVPISQADTPTG